MSKFVTKKERIKKMSDSLGIHRDRIGIQRMIDTFNKGRDEEHEKRVLEMAVQLSKACFLKDK